MTLPFVSRECWNSPRNIRNPLPLGSRSPPRGRFQGGDLPLPPLGHHFTPFRGTLHPSPPPINPHRSLFRHAPPRCASHASSCRPDAPQVGPSRPVCPLARAALRSRDCRDRTRAG